MPQDQDDIKGVDAMKQAPTPGPLSVEISYEVYQGDDFCASADRLQDAEHYANVYGQDGPVKCQTVVSVRHDDFLLPDDPRLAPTAPVEASGSEREAMEAALAELKRIPAPLTDDGDVTSWDSRNEVAAGIHAAETWLERALNLRPQPSGETREVAQDIASLKSQFERIAAKKPDDQPAYRDGCRPFGTGDLRHFIEVLGKAETLLSARPAPVASGGQHSSATDFPPDDVLACVPVAETAGEAVAWIDPADLAQVDEGLATETVLFPREHASATAPLYAAPVPAQDDDKLRIAVEALEEVASLFDEESYSRTGSIERRAGDKARQALAALKSTAAQEGGSL